MLTMLLLLMAIKYKERALAPDGISFKEWIKAYLNYSDASYVSLTPKVCLNFSAFYVRYCAKSHTYKNMNIHMRRDCWSTKYYR